MFISILCTVRNSLTIKRARKVNSMIINEFPDVDGNDFSTFSFLLYQLCKRIELRIINKINALKNKELSIACNRPNLLVLQGNFEDKYQE